MSNFKEIIDYLKFFRRTEDAEEKNKFRAAINVDEDYVYNKILNATIIDENDLIFVEKEAIAQQNGYKFVSGEIIGNLFLINQTSSIKEYYIKKEDDTISDVTSLYKRIPYEFSNVWVEKEDDLFVEIEIDEVSNFYYDYQHATIIEVFLENVFVFPDYFVYHPKDITISSDSSFSFNFKDEEGYTTDISDRFLRVLFSSNQNVLISETKRIVTFYKSEKPGYVYLLPKIKISLNRYTLDYNYYQRGIPFNRSINNPAITLSFKSIGAMAEFLNQTLFYELNTIDQFINDDESTFSARELFLEDYVQLITSEIAFGGSDKVLEILYYVPVFLFQKIDTNLLWSIIDNTLEDRVTNAGLNKEDIVLHILEGILSSSINENIFLLELIKENRNKKTRFALLYEKMNGDNFVSLTTFIYNTWLKSSFVEIDNNYFINSNGPLNLPYKSEKFAGFFSSNKNFDFIKNNQILVTEDESWIDNVVSFFDPELGEWVEQLVEEQNKYVYHYYQPILLANIEQESAIALPKLLPAYFLKANEDKAFWSNIITSLEYTVDVVTTLSGVGNIAKFRHLANVAKVASRFSKYQKASKFASTISKIRLVAGAIEISSGSLNILLKLTELRETPFGQALTEYLFYLELLSLSGELTAAIKNGLRKGANKLIKHEDEIRKQLDEVVIEDGNSTRKLTETDKTKFFEELKKVADNTINQTPEQMWKEYKYADLFPPPTPPKKPCFLAGTLVKTQSGLVAIETIKEGAKVLTYNFDTKKNEYQAVLQTFSNYAEKYLEIHTENEVLKVTGAHLFYLPKENKWIAASQLKLDMQLIDAHQNLVAIKKLDIIKKDVSTYNLEVAQNHNYYVGEEEILTHNDSKKLKFTNTELFDFEFYEYLDYNNKPLYVGQTTQGLTKRADQHLAEYNKTPAKKEFMKNSPDPKQIRLPFNPKGGPYKMTPFEAAITEMYELNTRGGKRINDKGLFNKKNPVSKRTFDKIKKDFPNFNPCRFYV